MLSERDLAGLTNRLQVPLVVQDILDKKEPITDDLHYSLHSILSDYEPDSALLCIALSARKIASKFQHKVSNLAILKMECDRIIADYAELWLNNAKDRPVDENLVFDTLMNIPEDLESLTELLEINQAFLARHSQNAADLCEVLVIQANAHILVAETFVEVFDSANDEPLANDNAIDELPIKVYADNVIQFPNQAN